MADPAPQTPQWWLQRLQKKLQQRQIPMRRLDGYYHGAHPLPFVTKAHTAKMHNEFRQLLEDSQANFMGLVVDSIEDRLKVEGFRLSARSSVSDDARSWEIWQANQMDAESKVAFSEALVKGMSYLSVWEGDEYPLIAVEDPCETIVDYKPGTGYRQRAAALKMWTDDWTGKRRANVYLTDGIYKFEADAAPATTATSTIGRWFNRTSDDAVTQWNELKDQFVENPIGIVPIVPIRNRPSLLCEGESELDGGLTRIQNAINGFLFLLALAGYFGAHKQRWATGVKLMFDERTGKALEPWDVAVDKFIADENPNAKFGEFQDTSLDGYIKAIDQKVQHLSVISRVPKHYLLPEGQEPSGDAIKSAESGLVKKVEKKQVPFGEGIEEAMRLARLFDGAADAPVDGEVVWADAQTESEAVRTDATIKQYEAKIIPWEFAAEKLGYSQTEIARMRGMRQADLLERQLLEAGENVNLNIST